jgi:hypothetical protein
MGADVQLLRLHVDHLLARIVLLFLIVVHPPENARVSLVPGILASNLRVGEGLIFVLKLVIFPLKLTAELLQLLFERHSFVELVPAAVLVFLQLVPSFLVLDTLALVPLHIREEIGTSFRQVLDFLELAHLRGLTVQLPIRLPNLPLDISFLILLAGRIVLELRNSLRDKFGRFVRLGCLLLLPLLSGDSGGWCGGGSVVMAGSMMPGGMDGVGRLLSRGSSRHGSRGSGYHSW